MHYRGPKTFLTAKEIGVSRNSTLGALGSRKLRSNLGTRRLADGSGQQVQLSNGDFNLLAVLVGSPQRWLTRGQLLERSRLHDDEVYERSVDIQIMRLRRKIEKDPAQPRYIKTERGVGYFFGVPVQTVY